LKIDVVGIHDLRAAKFSPNLAVVTLNPGIADAPDDDFLPHLNDSEPLKSIST
jgi:hypothetical protein